MNPAAVQPDWTLKGSHDFVAVTQPIYEITNNTTGANFKEQRSATYRTIISPKKSASKNQSAPIKDGKPGIIPARVPEP